MNETVSKAEYEALKADYEALRHELEQLRRLIFGSKRKRFVSAVSPEQLVLELDGEPELPAPEPATESITYQRRKKQHSGRTPLPEHIHAKDVIIEPEEDTSGMQLIGEEVTETVDYRPGILFKRRYIRRKYVRQEEDGQQRTVAIDEAPSRPIPRGVAEAGLLFVAKCVDHLPFYRQIEQFKRNHGWAIHKSTLNGWFGMHGPKERLADFDGRLQCNGYEAYKSIARKSSGAVRLVNCIAHIRRKFHEAKDHHPYLAECGLGIVLAFKNLELLNKRQRLNTRNYVFIFLHPKITQIFIDCWMHCLTDKQGYCSII